MVIQRLKSRQGYETPLGILPGVTTILRATMNPEKEEHLRKWRHKMDSLRAAGHDVDPEEGLKRGRVIDTAINGFYSCGRWPQLPEDTLGHWRSIEGLVRAFRATHWQEAIYHPTGYAGTFDAFGSYLDKECVLIDWKTAKRPQKREWLEDYWLQVTAYAQAWEWLGHPVKWVALGIAMPDYRRELHILPYGGKWLELWDARLAAYKALPPPPVFQELPVG